MVIGGGNLFRGKALSEAGLGRVTGDYMGMLATVMNALAFRDALERIDLPARIMSAIPMLGVVDRFTDVKQLRIYEMDMWLSLPRALVIHSLPPIAQLVCVPLKSMLILF